MKIAEVRSILEKHSDKQLRLIIAEMYKAIPKAVKEDKDIDDIIKNPDMLIKNGKKTKKQVKLPDIEELKYETEEFIDYAYEQYYFAPNSFVHKKDRPKWRFIAKRLYKNLTLVSQSREDLPQASELLEKLYVLLCYSCDYILFSAYDTFQSVGIEQKEFFHRVLSLKYKHENKPDFVKNAISLMVNNSLNRYTLYSTLMYVILEFLKTPDMKELGVDKCKELLQSAKNEKITSKDRTFSNFGSYEKERKIQNLSGMGFLCYAQLHDYDAAIDFFEKNYAEKSKEVKLYILLELIFAFKQKDYWLRVYEKAEKNGVQPRDSLKKIYQFIKEKGELPNRFH